MYCHEASYPSDPFGTGDANDVARNEIDQTVTRDHYVVIDELRKTVRLQIVHAVSIRNRPCVISRDIGRNIIGGTVGTTIQQK